MARPKKLSPIQIEETLALYDQGYNATQIQAHLLQNHNVSIAIKNISRYIRALRDARQEATDLAFKNAIAKTAKRDVAILDKKIVQLDKLTDKLLEAGDYKFARDFQETLLKFVSRKIDLNGDSGELVEETNNLLDSLMEKIKKN